MRKQQPCSQNPLLRSSYSMIAPLIRTRWGVSAGNACNDCCRALRITPSTTASYSGAGTGLDLPWLPKLHHYTALDFNPAMLARARRRDEGLTLDFVLGDSMALPFDDATFDHVVLHLILAVVPEPRHCLGEAARVLKPGGTVILFDKFLQPRQRAPLRRLLSRWTRLFATRMDVVFEEVLQSAPELSVVSDTPMLGRGWFRAIVLRRAEK
jgi:phosphatidylethanolamine/phosphatidyl-N-methylethanolamine N-methyltransferase